MKIKKNNKKLQIKMSSPFSNRSAMVAPGGTQPYAYINFGLSVNYSDQITHDSLKKRLYYTVRLERF